MTFLWRRCHLKYLSSQTCLSEVPHSIGQRQGSKAFGSWRRNCRKLLGSKMSSWENSAWLTEGINKKIHNTWIFSNSVCSSYALTVLLSFVFTSDLSLHIATEWIYFFQWALLPKWLFTFEIRRGFKGYVLYVCYANCSNKYDQLFLLIVLTSALLKYGRLHGKYDFQKGQHPKSMCILHKHHPQISLKCACRAALEGSIFYKATPLCRPSITQPLHHLTTFDIHIRWVISKNIRWVISKKHNRDCHSTA
jgi:hypothetical protein